MGKKGDELRAQKQRSAARMYTPEQIEQIKRQAVLEDREAMEKLRGICREADKKMTNDFLNEEWKKREQAFRGADEDESFQKVLALMMHIPTTVLCRDFHWKPIGEESDHRNNLKRFVDAVLAEVEQITGDENMDIRRYAEECYEKYGVKYEVE